MIALTGIHVASLAFDPPLTEQQLLDWVSRHLHDRSDLLLWGNPITLGPTKYHVYGLDLATYMPLAMEFTVRRMVFVANRQGDMVLPPVLDRVERSLACLSVTVTRSSSTTS